VSTIFANTLSKAVSHFKDYMNASATFSKLGFLFNFILLQK